MNKKSRDLRHADLEASALGRREDEGGAEEAELLERGVGVRDEQRVARAAAQQLELRLHAAQLPRGEQRDGGRAQLV